MATAAGSQGSRQKCLFGSRCKVRDDAAQLYQCTVCSNMFHHLCASEWSEEWSDCGCSTRNPKGTKGPKTSAQQQTPKVVPSISEEQIAESIVEYVSGTNRTRRVCNKENDHDADGVAEREVGGDEASDEDEDEEEDDDEDDNEEVEEMEGEDEQETREKIESVKDRMLSDNSKACYFSSVSQLIAWLYETKPFCLNHEFKSCLDNEPRNRGPITKKIKELLKRRELLPFNTRRFSYKQWTSYVVNVMMKKKLKFSSYVALRSGVRHFYRRHHKTKTYRRKFDVQIADFYK
ncbi:hypothetical protein GUITHDRAFT_121198, partial [Guillardia theta CCMP2712]